MSEGGLGVTITVLVTVEGGVGVGSTVVVENTIMVEGVVEEGSMVPSSP